MDGVHDIGGMHGFGKVPYEKDQATFKHEWERRIWGLCKGTYVPAFVNLDYARHALERIPPDLYLSYSYFERWLHDLTATLLENGLLDLEELRSGKTGPGGKAGYEAPGPETADPYVQVVYRREVEALARFQVGDLVRTGNQQPAGHTRLPRYARDKVGRVVRHHGAQILPDSNAHNLGENPTHLYSVAFEARTLWGPDASPRDKVFLDIWECHLEEL